jgi:hypothetical protein
MFKRPSFFQCGQADKKAVLLLGMGGGYDVFCGIPILFELQKEGVPVVLANLSFAFELDKKQNAKQDTIGRDRTICIEARSSDHDKKTFAGAEVCSLFGGCLFCFIDVIFVSVSGQLLPRVPTGAVVAFGTQPRHARLHIQPAGRARTKARRCQLRGSSGSNCQGTVFLWCFSFLKIQQKQKTTSFE